MTAAAVRARNSGPSQEAGRESPCGARAVELCSWRVRSFALDGGSTGSSRAASLSSAEFAGKPKRSGNGELRLQTGMGFDFMLSSATRFRSRLQVSRVHMAPGGHLSGSPVAPIARPDGDGRHGVRVPAPGLQVRPDRGVTGPSLQSGIPADGVATPSLDAKDDRRRTEFAAVL